jgi:hypothetical protein
MRLLSPARRVSACVECRSNALPFTDLRFGDPPLPYRRLYLTDPRLSEGVSTTSKAKQVPRKVALKRERAIPFVSLAIEPEAF